MKVRKMGEPPPPEENPLDAQRVWGFFQHQDGVVYLSVINQGVPVPVIAFLTPSALMDFEDDIAEAVDRFVPRAVQQAEEIVRKGWDADARCEVREPGTKPVEPTPPPGGEAPPQ